MEKVYSGKTKDIYKQKNGNLFIRFKDDVTGEGGVVDPGANKVMGQIKGKGRMSLELTDYFFKMFMTKDIPTHLVSVDLQQNAMEVKPAVLPGQDVSGEAGGLEFVCRRLAYGSFLRRYQKYIGETLKDLDFLVEITLKDDERGDPLINDDTIIALDILDEEQLCQAKELTCRIAKIINHELGKKGLKLVDMKIEFGLIDGEIVLVDELSADSMRVMDGKNNVLSHGEVYTNLIRG